MKRIGLVLAAVLGLVACGGDDGGGSSGGGSFGAISNAIAMPTGTVDMATAPSIGMEFEKIQNSSAGGERFEQAGSSTQMIACPSGGTQTFSASGSQGSGTVNYVYDNCCYSAGCCFSGDGQWFYSTMQGAEYSYCGNYDVALSCGGEGGSNVSYEGCVGANGQWTYVVRVEGETFAVNGNYSSGNGTLEIRGANGMYSCTYTNGTGSCTGDGSFSF